MGIPDYNTANELDGGRWQPDFDPDYSGELQHKASSPVARAAVQAAERVPIQSYAASPPPAAAPLVRNNPAPAPVQSYRDGIWLRPNRRPAARWSANVAVQLAGLTLALTLLTIFLPHQWFILTVCWIVLVITAIHLALAWANHQRLPLTNAMLLALRDIGRFIGMVLVAMSRRR